jgi:hypothetical protein
MVWDAKEIQARLAAIRAADPGLDRFGASRHRHRLGRRLSKGSVTSFESAHGVPLPEAYRSFLLDVGNGGAGPHYGLFPLDGRGMRDLERTSVSGPDTWPLASRTAKRGTATITHATRIGPAPSCSAKTNTSMLDGPPEPWSSPSSAPAHSIALSSPVLPAARSGSTTALRTAASRRTLTSTPGTTTGSTVS